MRKIFALYTILLLIVTTGCSNSSMQKKSNEMDSIQPDKEAPILTPLPSPDTIAPTIDSILAMREKEIPPLPPIKKEIKRNGDLLVPPVKVKGIYVTGPTAGIQRMNELTDLVVSTGMNTIVLDIKNDGGNITYKMEHPVAKEIGACKRFVRNMPALLDTLHAKNIYVIGRIVCFKDSYLAKAKPQLAIQNPDSTLFTDSKGQIWVNPYNEAVWDYLCSLAEKAIEDGKPWTFGSSTVNSHYEFLLPTASYRYADLSSVLLSTKDIQKVHDMYVSMEEEVNLNEFEFDLNDMGQYSHEFELDPKVITVENYYEVVPTHFPSYLRHRF